MAKTRPALGRGLSALIPEPPSPHTRERPTEVDLDRLTPNRFQPRTVMDEPKLDALSRSIQSSGVIQPIIVRRLDSDTLRSLPASVGGVPRSRPVCSRFRSSCAMFRTTSCWSSR